MFFSALFLIASCAIFPFGWDCAEVRQACGDNAKNYELGSCTIGWAAYLVAAGAIATLACSCMSLKSGKSDRMKALAYEARYDTLQLKSNGTSHLGMRV